MFCNFLVEIPKSSKITYNKQKDKTYVEYTYDRIYNPEKKYNTAKRRCIGKLDPDNPGKMYPNQNFAAFFPDVKLPGTENNSLRSGCLRTGCWLVIRKIIEEYRLEEILLSFMTRGSGLLLDLAAYSIVSENNDNQYYTDYVYNHPLFTEEMRVYKDTDVSDFVSETDDDLADYFLCAWNSLRDHREKIYISFNMADKSCKPGDTDITDNIVLSLAAAYGSNNSVPLFYEEYPSSVVDAAYLQFMLEKAEEYGYRNTAFILDGGCYGSGCTEFMDRKGCDFVIALDGSKPLAKEILTENMGSFENDQRNMITCGLYAATIKSKLTPDDKKERYFHLYFSPQKCSSERDRLEKKISYMKSCTEKLYGWPVVLDEEYTYYFEGVYSSEGQEDRILQSVNEKSGAIKEESSLCGYFCIITSQKMSAEKALDLYTNKDASEELLRDEKSFLYSRTPETDSDYNIQAKIFIRFVAMIIRSRM